MCYANEQELIVMGHVLNQLKKDYDFLSKNLKRLVSNRFISD
jgi:hypothetical protein